MTEWNRPALQQALDLIKNGKKVSEAAKESGVPVQTIYSAAQREKIELPSTLSSLERQAMTLEQRYGRDKRKVGTRPPDLLPLGTVVKLSSQGLEADGPRNAGLSATSRGEVVLGRWPDQIVLAVHIDGEPEEATHWPTWVWEPV